MSKKRSAKKNQPQSAAKSQPQPAAKNPQPSAAKNQPQPAAKNPQPPAAKNQPQPAKKTRGTLITAVLVIVVLHGILMSVAYWSMIEPGQRTLGNWMLLTMVATSVADIVAAAALWFWKRWGMILYGVAAVVQAVITVLATQTIILIFGALLPAIIVLYILATKRDQFE